MDFQTVLREVVEATDGGAFDTEAEDVAAGRAQLATSASDAKAMEES